MEKGNSPTMEILSTNIKLIRKERHLTQEQLAERTELTVKYISHLERGLSFPSAESLDKIASALKVPVYRLFFPEGQTSIVPRDVLKRELHRIIDEMA